MTVFRPVREADVIFMQQVTEIYGGEGGWGALTQHKMASTSGLVLIARRGTLVVGL